MIQQVMTAPGVIEFREIPTPKPGRGEVLIKMMRIGICGSDIHVYHGTHPFTSYPVTQGHEVSGEIVELGEGVTNFRQGQKVTVQPQLTCGKCYPCRHGKYNLCDTLKVMGFQTTGMASTFFATDAARVVALPDNVSYDEGAIIEPTAVAVHAVRRAGEVDGKSVVVIGAGPIGNLVAQTAKAMGAGKVMISGHGGERLELAKKCGVDVVTDTNKEDFDTAIISAFGSDRADVIFDCAGNDISINQAIRSARKGSTIILVAVFGKMANADLAVLNDHEIDLNTTMMYRREDYEKAIQLVSDGVIAVKPLITNHFKFADYLDAYKYIDGNKSKAMKVVIDIQD